MPSTCISYFLFRISCLFTLNYLVKGFESSEKKIVFFYVMKCEKCGVDLDFTLRKKRLNFRNIFLTSSRISSDFKIIPEDLTFLRYRL